MHRVVYTEVMTVSVGAGPGALWLSAGAVGAGWGLVRVLSSLTGQTVVSTVTEVVWLVTIVLVIVAVVIGSE